MSGDNTTREPDEFYGGVVKLLREITGNISAPLLEKGIAVEHAGTPEAAALQLKRREQEDRAIRALHKLVHREGEWGLVADAVKDSEAWWVYMVLVERAHETLPDQIGGDA